MNEVTKIKQKEDNPENWETLRNQLHTGTLVEEGNPEVVLDSLPDLMETFEKEKAIEKINEHLNDTFVPRNRAERRALEKATRRQKIKQKRMYVDNIKEAAQKLAYINMIEKVRELNKQIEEEGEIENEAANEGNPNV